MRRNYNYENVEEQQPKTSVSSSNKLTYLLVGGGIGALVALLFAPKAGQELRGDIADVTRKGYDKTLETAHQLKEQSGTYYQQIKEQAGDAYNATATKIKGITQQSGDGAESVNKTLNTNRDVANHNTEVITHSASDISNDIQKNQQPLI